MDELILKAMLVGVLAGLAGTYAAGWRRLRHAGYVVRAWRIAMYVAGLAVLAGALLSPIDDLAQERFSAHMIQHLVLTMAAAPLLLLGNPFPVTLWGLPPRARRAIGGLLTREARARRALAMLTSLPVAWLVYVVDLWAWHIPVLYDAALDHEVLHAAEHLAFFLTSILFWWPIVEPAPRVRRPAHPGLQIAYLVAATVQNTMLGMLLTFPERVWYAHYAKLGAGALDDQMLAGGLMWGNGHMYLIPILVVLWRFSQRSAGHDVERPADLPRDA
jgi:putative membrane protein